jgi:hypothetical protein
VIANDNRPNRRSPGPTPPSNRGNIVALVAIAALAAALFWIVSAIQKHNALQNCIDSGRHDCIEIPQGQAQ